MIGTVSVLSLLLLILLLLPSNLIMIIFHFLHQDHIEIERHKEEVLLSNQWGSFFADAGTAQEKDCDHRINSVLDGFFVCNKAKERREMNTFWGDVIQKYSTITIPRIDFITGNFPPVWII